MLLTEMRIQMKCNVELSENILQEHENWKDEIEAEENDAGVPGNVHIQSQWLENLTKNFEAEVVATWSHQARVAWETNQAFTAKDAQIVRRIRQEMTRSLG